MHEEGENRMKTKKIIAISLSAFLITTSSIHDTYAEDNKNGNVQTTTVSETAAGISDKSEVVYAKLSASGEVNAIYVVNHFKVTKSGNITDYGNYSSVHNLTESVPITMDSDMITVPVKEGDFYYQGNMADKELPWSIQVAYELDGQTVSPQEVAGKSGDLGIHITTRRNDKVNAVFFENYMLQISLSIASNKLVNLKADDATIAEAGNNTMLAFTVMPGKEVEYEVTAKVEDFEMNGIEISAMPFSMNFDMPDTDEMMKDFVKLPNAVSELNDGVGRLAKGTEELKKGADSLKKGSGEFENGLLRIDRNSSELIGASAQINQALATISQSVSGGTSDIDMSRMTQLPVALTELSEGLKGITGGLNQLKEGYAEAYSALDMSITTIPDSAISKDQLNTMFRDADADQTKLLNQLYESYVAGQTVKATYSQVKLAFASVAPTLENIVANIDKITAALDEMSKSIGSSMAGMDISTELSQLSGGLSELAKNYSLFDQGLQEYMNGVSSLSDGYRQFDDGFSNFVDGIGDLKDGVSELYDGTSRMEDEISDMPYQIQKEIDNLMEEYTGSDFEAVSYASPKNTNTGLVQFVLKGEAIKLSKVMKETEEVIEDKDTIIDRFLALFRKEEE
jgi:putative membrane protein